MISLQSRPSVSRKFTLVLPLMSVVAWSTASAQTLTTLANFDNTDGSYPLSGLIADPNGNLFGTTTFGGASNAGTVFEIVKTASGYATTPKTVVSFDINNGAEPTTTLIADGIGNLFGTTYGNIEVAPLGSSDLSWGTVFEIAKTASGYAAAPTTLFTFDGGIDGGEPATGLMADANGNIFGTTSWGGPYLYFGTVFEITKTTTGYASTPTTLFSFDATDGYFPGASLISDSNGNLVGTTVSGGTYSYFGTVFEIAKTTSGYASTPTTLVSFNGSNGGSPYGNLIADANGNLFGTTAFGGASNGGTVFEITKTASGYASTPTILVSFNRSKGFQPMAGLIADAKGNLFGTTLYGGASPGPLGDGTVFEIVKTASGYASTPTTLVSFNGNNGSLPYASLIADGNGNLFGTTSGGGTSSFGTVFEVTGTGFITPTEFGGTSGTTNCIGKSVFALTQEYGGLAQAAAALGYNSVAALQSTVDSYCSQ